MNNEPLPNQPLRQMDYTRIVVAGVLFIIIAFSVIYFYTNNHKIKVDPIPAPIGIEKTDPFKDTAILAQSAIIWDIQNQKVIYSKNPLEVRPLASLTKILSAFTASKQSSGNTIVQIRPIDLSAEGDSGLLIGEKWTLKNMLQLILVASSNDGAKAVASVMGSVDTNDDFVALMNETAQSIGLTNTYFYNENGLDVDEVRSGGYGTAKDVAILLDHIMQIDPELLEPTRYAHIHVQSQNNIPRLIDNTNTDIPVMPGLLASKTGYTDLAGGNLAVVVEPGMSGPFVIVVLGSDYEGRFNDVKILSDKLLEYVERQ